MSRLKQVQSFIEYDLKNNYIIEPKNRFEAVRERVFDVIQTYNPGVIIKAGIGHGDLLLDLVKKFNAYTVVVEPSFTAIKDFIQNYFTDKDAQNIKFINGDLHDLPVDYYAADLLICVDYLDFFDSGKSINEFKRILKFDGIFFIATVALDSNDIDGIYDEFIKLISPLHNDYYVPEDITTVLELKEFKMIKTMRLNFKNNLQSKIEYFIKIFNSTSRELSTDFIKTHDEEFKKYLQMDDNYEIAEPYFIGVYMRGKPASV